MSEAAPAPATQRPPAIRRWVTITEIDRVTPHLLRIRLQGADLAGFQSRGPGAHVKLVLPPPGEAKPATPISYEGRRAIYEEGVAEPFSRTYTPVGFDGEKLELAIELLLHGEGPASTWAEGAAIGDEIVVLGPGGGWEVPQDGDWYVIAADETAFPAAGQVMQAMPKTAHAVLFEIGSDEDERPIPGTGSAPVTWLLRGSDATKAGEPIEQAIRGLAFPEGKGYVWLACEAAAMRRIRKHLVEERGLPPEQLVTRGYWKLGASNHPDGDYGQDLGARG
jgi:NADPH-dependent ferric siderophore reductase